MITVKNVTHGSVAFSVAKTDDTVALLSQVKEFSCLNFRRIKVTREFWSKELNIHRETLRRWEVEIINSDLRLCRLYFKDEEGNSLRSKQMLDTYQRFFLTLIASLKKGVVTNCRLTNKEVVKYLTEKGESGLPRYWGLTRKEFSKSFKSWKNNQNANYVD